MKNYFKNDEWNIIEEGFRSEDNLVCESAMSLGNGRMGIRGNFEEAFSGESLSGTYIAGVYYPDKTRVGWWKNGYPEYFAKVLNAVNFIGINVFINGEELDLAKVKTEDFKRVLNMKEGYLLRTLTVVDSQDRRTRVEVKRFLSMAKKEIAAVSYSLTPVNYDAEVTFMPYLDGDVKNQDSNYDEKFWDEVDKNVEAFGGFLTQKTKKSDFAVSAAMKYTLSVNDYSADVQPELLLKDKFVGNRISVNAAENSKISMIKYIAVTSSRYYEKEQLAEKALKSVKEACSSGFDVLFKEHADCWLRIWEESDIVIKNDTAAQQAIRFNIFHMNQTYTGDDPRLNIGPKGFTGEKYGGSTYWDTEAYCIPFYLSTSNPSISRNLLIYRYNHLGKAKENARKLGVSGALYPMVTMNGEECHNEWEITFEEIHRNAAIAYAIFNYVRYTGDESYLPEYGFEVLTEISRFWASRVSYNKFTSEYMLLGVTGPNEYENNVNNNWYTNTMASWCLEYTLEIISLLKKKFPERYEELIKRLQLSTDETDKWNDIIKKIRRPYSEEFGVYLQQDGYLDKEQILVKDLPKEELPLNQKWSWDRILRSCFIKQADVLQGLYFLNDRFDLETKKKNFDFYEARTVHESSLSPCIYSILASELGYEDKAYELYLRTARLDIDNYNNDTEDGLHITSMAGTWMSVVHGFGGLRIKNGMLSLNPFVPKAWTEYSFKIMFRGHLLKVTAFTEGLTIEQQSGKTFSLTIRNNVYEIGENGTLIMSCT